MSVLSVMSLNLRYGAVHDSAGAPEDRWPGLAELIRREDPDIVLFQEASGWTERCRRQWARAERDLGMRIHVGPSSKGVHTAIGHRGLAWEAMEDRYCTDSWNGFTHLLLNAGLSQPLAVISAHLPGICAPWAAHELSLLVWRIRRHGAFGVIGGDINHPPRDLATPDDPALWASVPYHDLVGRTLHGVQPYTADLSVATVARHGGLTDVAAHIADTYDDAPRAPTAHAGGLRVDWFLITEELLPALVDYHQVPTHPYSDHDAIVMTLDTGNLQRDRI